MVECTWYAIHKVQKDQGGEMSWGDCGECARLGWSMSSTAKAFCPRGLIRHNGCQNKLVTPVVEAKGEVTRRTLNE